MKTDVEKVIKAIKGSKSALTEIMHECKGDIYKIAYLYMKNEDEALEVLNEVVYKVCISIRKLKSPEYFNTWLTRITINIALNTLKKKKRVTENETQVSHEDISKFSIEERMEDNLVLKMDLMESIDKLQFNEKTVIILKYFEDLTIPQIADILSWPVGTVKTRLYKALAFLKSELDY